MLRRRAATRSGHVAMFHHGRCGSSVLGDLLDQHSALRWDGEVFNFKRSFWTERATATECADPLAVLERRVEKSRKSIYGFECKFYHARRIGFSLEELVPALEKRGFTRFVVLDRRNTLRKVVSSLVAARRGSARLPAGVVAPLLRVHVPVDAVPIDSTCKPLVELLREYQDSVCRIETLLADRPLLRLRYEDDLAQDPLAGYRTACDFLGLAVEQPEVRFSRTTPHPWRQVVENPEAVTAALAGTEFEWMTAED
ncbi:hypothetical protein KJ059_16350 [Myxococcota bacterium]|nr:hypothetical protein [Myxococcota bacterium]MCZ7616806.1 sulfotransferase [Myxococcota bacterium]